MRNSIHYLAVAAALLLSLVLSGCGHNENLFNGKNLDGWVCTLAIPEVTDSLAQPVTPPVEETFFVKDGVLHITGEPFGYIRTEKKYAEYMLILEWRWAGPRTDGGIYTVLQDGDKVWPAGIQLQLRDSDFGYLFSALPLEGIEGPFYRKPPVFEKSPEKAEGEWNQTVILCKDGKIAALVNGVLVNEAKIESTEGYIGFQSEGGPIEFRRIIVHTD